MTAQRRMGAPDAKNRGVLLDAAEKLLLEEGYAAVTSRRVASRAGLKSQLVHYYFRTMDDLFLALFSRRAEEGLRHQQQLLESERPLHALWEFNTESTGIPLTMEFTSLANRRPAIRDEITRYSEQFRQAQLKVVSVALERYEVSPEVCTPESLVVVMTAIARVISMEKKLGLFLGHNETVASMERFLDRIEPPARD